MKSKVFTAVFIIIAVFCMFSERAYGQAPVDLVLVLDTSTGMTSSYNNVNNYLTGPFLTEFLRIGDTFHLITFSSSPRIDISRRISGIGDVETIIGRMLIQYPVEIGSNAGSAISFAEQYITTLPNRSKKIVLITNNNTAVNNQVTAARGRLSSRNTTIDYIQVNPGQPLTNLPTSNRTSDGTSAETAAGAGTAAAGTAQAGAGGRTGTGTGSGDRISTETGEQGDGTERDPDEITEGLEGSEEGEEGDQTSSLVQGENEGSGSALSLPFIIGIIILILLILGLLFFLLTRRLSSSPNRVMSDVASSGSSQGDSSFEDHSKDLASYAAGQSRQRTTPYDNRPSALDSGKPVVINPSGPLLLNLYVNDQSTSIGKRNIHSLKSGYNLSVGGGKADDFLIFLVPIPSNIGEIRRNGSQLSFVVKKQKYFPDVSGEVKDCINKTIRIVSDKNYEMRFRFEMYEDPLLALNRLLHSVKVPG